MVARLMYAGLFLLDPCPIIAMDCLALSVTKSFSETCWDLTDVTLACEDHAAPPKLDQFLAYDLTLSLFNFKTEARSSKLTIFSESWWRKVSVGGSPEKIFR